MARSRGAGDKPDYIKGKPSVASLADGRPIPQLNFRSGTFNEEDLRHIEHAFIAIKRQKYDDRPIEGWVECLVPALLALGPREANEVRKAFNQDPYDAVNRVMTRMVNDAMPECQPSQRSKPRAGSYRARSSQKNNGKVFSHAGVKFDDGFEE